MSFIIPYLYEAFYIFKIMAHCQLLSSISTCDYFLLWISWVFVPLMCRRSHQKQDSYCGGLYYFKECKTISIQTQVYTRKHICFALLAFCQLKSFCFSYKEERPDYGMLLKRYVYNKGGLDSDELYNPNTS